RAGRPDGGPRGHHRARARRRQRGAAPNPRRRRGRDPGIDREPRGGGAVPPPPGDGGEHGGGAALSAELTDAEVRSLAAFVDRWLNGERDYLPSLQTGIALAIHEQM